MISYPAHQVDSKPSVDEVFRNARQAVGLILGIN